MITQQGLDHLMRKMAQANTLGQLAEMWAGFGDSAKLHPDVYAAKLVRERKICSVLHRNSRIR